MRDLREIPAELKFLGRLGEHALAAAGSSDPPALVGAPLGWWLSTQSELGATGMWIANLV